MERCVCHITNTYYVPHIRVSGYLCATNLPSNTAFRGFGAPQGMFFAESIIDHISKELSIDPSTLREKNLFVNGQTTVYNQLISNFTVNDCWKEVLLGSKYCVMSNEAKQFNGYLRTNILRISFLILYML